ncbi:MAG: DUF5317 domain-containing protein [Chloroflexi bacterium]|nr:DUF5317 domain-containing protein [Chloroflexota bacterium]
MTRLNRPWVIALAVLLQAIAAVAAVRGLGGAGIAALVAGSYVTLAIGAASNLRYWGFRLFLLGVILNALVIGLNGWRMPVDREALRRVGDFAKAELPSGTDLWTPKHTVMDRVHVTAWPLADVIAVPPIGRVFSAGDLFIYSGTAIVLVELVSRWRAAARTEHPAARASTSQTLR